MVLDLILSEVTSCNIFAELDRIRSSVFCSLVGLLTIWERKFLLANSRSILADIFSDVELAFTCWSGQEILGRLKSPSRVMSGWCMCGIVTLGGAMSGF